MHKLLMKNLNSIDRHDALELHDQIKVREELLTQMVGNLYPAMIRNEIATIRFWLDLLDVPSIAPPLESK